MTIAFEHDRLAQLLFARSEQAPLADIRLRLDSMALVLSVDAAVVGTAWAQAAAMAIVASGDRMFRAGVFLADVPPTATILMPGCGQPLVRTLEGLGARRAGAPTARAFHLHIGHGSADLHVGTAGWTATVSPKSITPGKPAGNVVSGVLAGAMAVSEAFRRGALGAGDAGRIAQQINAWAPGSTETVFVPIMRLPSALWLIGLGNLGQAQLFTLSLLPFADRSAVTLMLQDFDRSGPENLTTQILTRYGWIGHRKASMAAAYMHGQGFETFAVERRFAHGHGPAATEPRIALVGVDNPQARRLAATAGFDWVIDAGLGGTPAEIFDIAVHAFPGHLAPETIWPESADARPEIDVPARYTALVEAGVLDMCGATTIAGQAVGVPSTALAAAALQIAQLCRVLATGGYCDSIDLRLARTGSATSTQIPEASLALPALLPSGM
jgi:hypothetical protein